MRDRGEFLENALVHGNRYGTSKKVIAETLERGQDLVLEIDWQGPRRCATLPGLRRHLHPAPSVEELERRLRGRGRGHDVVIQRRLANAQAEMAHAGEFEYRIINKDFDTAKAELAEIVRASRRAS